MPSKSYALTRKPEKQNKTRLFRARRVLGDSLGAFRHGVLGEFTWEDEANRGLDLPGRNGGLLVVGGKLAGLGGNALEDICNWESENVAP